MKTVFLAFLVLSVNLSFAQKTILDKGFKNTEGISEMAVMIINGPDNSLNQPLTQDIADVLKNSKGYRANPSFFNTSFIKKGQFEKIFNADGFNFKKLHLEKNLDYICLGKYQVNGMKKNEFDLYVADVSLQINIIDVKSGAVIDSHLYTDKGTGITKADAEINARGKITEQLK